MVFWRRDDGLFRANTRRERHILANRFPVIPHQPVDRPDDQSLSLQFLHFLHVFPVPIIYYLASQLFAFGAGRFSHEHRVFGINSNTEC